MKSLGKCPPIPEALGQLVAAPSISSTQADIDQGNIEVVQLLANWLDDLGFQVQIDQLDAAAEKANLYASIGPDKPGGILFSGHLDTVPCDPQRWSADPFSLTETSLGYQGLGSTDMKGFFAVLLQCFAGLHPHRLDRPVSVIATADEESSMTGGRALRREHLHRSAAVIIGEPTDLQPIRMHKGIMMEALRVTGQGGHSSDPSLGLNAMEVMQDLMANLLQLRTELQQQHKHPGFAVQVPTLNLGCIHGGDNPNRICSQCEIQFDLRTLPGMLNQPLRERIDQLAQSAATKWGCRIERVSLFPGVDSFEQEQGSELVEISEALSGQVAQAVSFATEAPFFKALGANTLVMGPGSIKQAHRVDEYLPGAQLDPAVALYSKLIDSYCVDPRG